LSLACSPPPDVLATPSAPQINLVVAPRVVNVDVVVTFHRDLENGTATAMSSVSMKTPELN